MCFCCDVEVYGNPKFWWWSNYVCWTCRIQNGVKKTATYSKEIGRICYRCHQPMTDVGYKFRTPKKNDVKKWNQLKNTWSIQKKYINGEQTCVAPKILNTRRDFKYI